MLDFIRELESLFSFATGLTTLDAVGVASLGVAGLLGQKAASGVTQNAIFTSVHGFYQEL